ncbi:multicomponent Na+:H+ antiporter subunit G [Salinibacter ruber]|jgi:multicomponent Na+:H+ antiporter subunit G|uniref:Monovalent cation/proton antiporter, MnhG/PhaG subunit subfamily n=3 Tax=Salinibacter ruber TaxID=146919 RepID=Q2S1W6_SALRD|nr:monovalent cation/H(+) antiporter subunit G [Salinibacter ruber]ABC44503.1 monovalent cation/proton antiporter, MnhG/PhaG subunit subfamily [Salinibacter ruber DSM 13855]MBB4060493.1 multicomponent Na+:H+ antiporter subunit G [Salinibacter ruber]MBB4067966.1 multicomponent Na+:H+ antiporter subunit G [Salinibacter ruber]MBB4090054.1 multicomponent Na+:H+ antiporter subunit G [Salinibacter ruber]MCS3632377.1 multicomponent Na+:H+ antiporter subunit G [Salinibacter ruber]
MLAQQIVGIFLMTTGTLFVFVAGLGVLRLPDVYMRLHASTKAGTLGVALNAAGLVVFHPDLGIFTRAFALVLFLLLTAPVAAHMIGRASYFAREEMGVSIWDGTVVDRMLDHRGEALFSTGAPEDGADASGSPS